MAVLGIGGLFFRARDPEALAAWYKQHLGVGPGCAAPGTEAGSEWVWMTQAGPVVFAPFPSDSDYFSSDKAFMLNLRVSGLTQLIERLENAAIPVETRDEWNDPNIGNFARIHDPEGNPVELWEPASA
jgi:catechol 2,3-dioxygenase-like lactoylglutathione lyase family enzyme